MLFTKRASIIEKITCKTKNQKQTDKSKIPLTLVTTFDPWLRQLPKTIRRCWEEVENDPQLSIIFPNPIVIAYKKNKTISSKLVTSKIPNQPKPIVEQFKAPIKTIVPTFERNTSPCKFINCKSCLAITKSNTITSTATKKTYQIT